MEIELENLDLSIPDGFCFKDALRDNLLVDMALLERPIERFDRKPEGPNELREPRKELQDEDLKAKIHAKVDELDSQKLSELWAFLAGGIAHTEAKPIPNEPPGGQLYENRSDKREKAPDFIQRVYGEWLNGTFTRADLRRIDPKGEMALRSWEHRSGQRASINLPTIQERNDQQLEAAGPWESTTTKEVIRLRAAAMRRAKKR